MVNGRRLETWMREKGFISDVTANNMSMFASFLFAFQVLMWLKWTAEVHACLCNELYYITARLSFGNPPLLQWGVSKPVLCFREKGPHPSRLLLQRQLLEVFWIQNSKVLCWHTQWEYARMLSAHGRLTLPTIILGVLANSGSTLSTIPLGENKNSSYCTASNNKLCIHWNN